MSGNFSIVLWKIINCSSELLKIYMKLKISQGNFVFFMHYVHGLLVIPDFATLIQYVVCTNILYSVLLVVFKAKTIVYKTSGIFITVLANLWTLTYFFVQINRCFIGSKNAIAVGHFISRCLMQWSISFFFCSCTISLC